MLERKSTGEHSLTRSARHIRRARPIPSRIRWDLTRPDPSYSRLQNMERQKVQRGQWARLRGTAMRVD